MKTLSKKSKAKKQVLKVLFFLFLIYVISFFIVQQVRIQKKRQEIDNLKSQVTTIKEENKKLAEEINSI